PPVGTALWRSAAGALTTSGAVAWRVPPVSVYVLVPALLAVNVSVPPVSVLAPVTPLVPDNVRLPGPVTVRPALPVMAELTVVVPLPVMRTPSWAPRTRPGTERVLPVLVPPPQASMPLPPVSAAAAGPPMAMPA